MFFRGWLFPRRSIVLGSKDAGDRALPDDRLCVCVCRPAISRALVSGAAAGGQPQLGSTLEERAPRGAATGEE